MDKAVLVLNAGSSSLKFAVFRASDDSDRADALIRGQIAGIGTTPVFQATYASPLGSGERLTHPVDDIDTHQKAIALALKWLTENARGLSLIGVGHRVVHGGASRREPMLVSDSLMAELDRLSPLAPHHQPHNLAAIRAVTAAAPELAQVACFDTAFHADQPAVARLLPLPAQLRAQGLQRYGFHGLSYEFITDAVPAYNDGQLPERLIVAHLGNGASLCAIRDGESVATSMGFSTLDGLLMGTRCGSVDPGVLLHLMRAHGMDEPALSQLLYNESGLLGVSGISGDMQDLLQSDEPGAAEAVDLFCYTLVRNVGSMTAALGGLDALVFTGGIGEHAAPIRQRVCEQLEWLGLAFDQAANEAGEALLTAADSRIKAWVIPTNEERVISRHTVRLVEGNRASLT